MAADAKVYADMRFIADGMLGKLARWLRLAGHDVLYVGDLKVTPEKQDYFLLERKAAERRTLLTADLELHKRAIKSGGASVLVQGKDVVSQLVELSKRVGEKIEISPESSRCPVCNGTLAPVAKAKVEKSVPESVIKSNQNFWQCQICGKIYWQGGHWKTIIEMASQYNSRLE